MAVILLLATNTLVALALLVSEISGKKTVYSTLNFWSLLMFSHLLMQWVYLSIQCCIAGKPTYVMKPNIYGPQRHLVRKWQDLVLECQGLADKGTKLTFTWLQPNSLVCQFFVYLFLSHYACNLSFLWHLLNMVLRQFIFI